MRIFNRLFAVPFVLCNLMAADAGGGSGGGGEPTPTPTPEPQPEPTPPTPPEPEGNTLEDKFTSAKGIIGKIFKQLSTALADLTKAQDNYSTLEGQFKALEKTAKEEKDQHSATKDLLKTQTDERNRIQGELDKQNKNVERLESLCQLRGIDPNQAVPASSTAKSSDEQRAELVSQLDKETDPLKRGEIANELRKLDAKRRKAEAA